MNGDKIPPDTFQHERELMLHGYTPVAGCDEAGRGPLAGPVVAASVVLPRECPYHHFIDSKKLSAVRRDSLYAMLQDVAVAIGIGLSTHEEIDSINILQASLVAMQRSVTDLSVKPAYILVDGTFPIPTEIPQKCLVKGELASASIAAASIVAKVTRDRLMDDLHKKYPVYGFNTNRGYPTAVHKKALLEHGPCPVHRMTFKGVRK